MFHVILIVPMPCEKKVLARVFEYSIIVNMVYFCQPTLQFLVAPYTVCKYGQCYIC